MHHHSYKATLCTTNVSIGTKLYITACWSTKCPLSVFVTHLRWTQSVRFLSVSYEPPKNEQCWEFPHPLVHHGAHHSSVMHNAAQQCTMQLCTIVVVHNVASTNPHTEHTLLYFHHFKFVIKFKNGFIIKETDLQSSQLARYIDNDLAKQADGLFMGIFPNLIVTEKFTLEILFTSTHLDKTHPDTTAFS